MGKRIKVEAHNTPTALLIDILVTGMGGGQLGTGEGQVINVCARDSGGASLGCTSITNTDWSNHTISKTITIQNSGSISYLSLVDSGEEEMYTYTLPSEEPVQSGDMVNVTWTIGWSNVESTLDVSGLLGYIESQHNDIKITKVVYKNGETVVYTDSAPTVTYDTSTDTVTVTSTVDNSAGTTDMVIDTVEFQNASGIPIVVASVSLTVPAGGTQPVTLNIKPQVGGQTTTVA